MELDMDSLSSEQIKELREKLAKRSVAIFRENQKKIMIEKHKCPEFIAKRNAGIRRRAAIVESAREMREALSALCREHHEALPTASGAAYVRALALLAETA